LVPGSACSDTSRSEEAELKRDTCGEGVSEGGRGGQEVARLRAEEGDRDAGEALGDQLLQLGEEAGAQLVVGRRGREAELARVRSESESEHEGRCVSHLQERCHALS
jgi:hypothetical protein